MNAMYNIETYTVELNKLVDEFLDFNITGFYSNLVADEHENPAWQINEVFQDIRQTVQDKGKLLNSIRLPLVIKLELLIKELLRRVDEIYQEFKATSVFKVERQEEIEAIYNSYFLFYDNGPNIPHVQGAALLCLSIRNSFNEVKTFVDMESRIQESYHSFEDLKSKTEDLYTKLAEKALEKVTDKYGPIYGRQSSKHKESANIWLAGGFFSILLFICFIVWEECIMPLPDGSPTKVTLGYVKHLLIISFFIYLISFIFRQYSINRNLQALNTHRKNTITSYDLFLPSLNKNDSETRELIITEIAKSIYEAGPTGYISLKDAPENNTLITEITKIIKDKTVG
jgi:hypothetical protein